MFLDGPPIFFQQGFYMRGRSVREVNSTNGRISFKEVLDFQKSV